MIQRLEPVIIEIERERECVCVVAHQAILRALYGYFTKCPLKVRGSLYRRVFKHRVSEVQVGRGWVRNGCRM